MSTRAIQLTAALAAFLLAGVIAAITRRDALPRVP